LFFIIENLFISFEKLDKKIRQRMRKKIYKKIYKRGLLMFLLIFLINVYFFKKGKNNSENNSMFIGKIDNFIDWIYITYYSLKEVNRYY